MGGQAEWGAKTALGSSLREQGRWDEARITHEDVATTADPWWAARSLYSLGLVEMERGDVEEAARRLENARGRFVTIGDQDSALDCACWLATVTFRGGDEAGAEAMCEELLEVGARDVAFSDTLAAASMTLSDIRRGHGDVAGARALLADALARSWGWPLLAGTADRRACRGDGSEGGSRAHAVVLFGLADRLRGTDQQAAFLDVESDRLWSPPDIRDVRRQISDGYPHTEVRELWRQGWSIDPTSAARVIFEALHAPR